MVRHLAIGSHDGVAMTRPIRLALATVVGGGVAVGLRKPKLPLPPIIHILLWIVNSI